MFRKPHILQGVYYLLTGIWLLLHIESFMWVSGPKVDLWLVKTVGVLVAIIGGALLVPVVLRKEESEVIPFLGVSSCLAFIFIDTYYVLIGRIWDIYLLDALAELVLLVLWLIYLFRKSRD